MHFFLFTRRIYQFFEMAIAITEWIEIDPPAKLRFIIYPR
jgi:hypothetical protein